MEDIRQLVDCIADLDFPAACDILHQWADVHGPEYLADGLMLPAMELFTQRYATAGQSPLAWGYVAARVADYAMQLVAESLPEVPRATRATVVLGNIEDDFHALGRRIVGSFLRAWGWQVVDLGNDVSAPRFVDAALEHRARVVGVSAMMYTTAQNIVTVRDEIDRRGLTGRLQLAVGGAVFTLDEGLVDRVGGDGTAPSAQHACALVQRLHDRALEAGDLA